MSDKKPLMDYVGEDGTQWIMAACGHYVGGSPKPGDKIALCPNCSFLAKFNRVVIVYEELLPDYLYLEKSTRAP